ncbi:hypothetical protein M2D07_024640 [Pseudomonas sp. BGr12]|uniref:hypothetical protein n=1 Tax=Pseudomonas sp. BGr12 TaxID=2936269 RepID=UPI0009DA175E|nr:hypothetical protein [Pseudomonas sp. BJa5]MDL2430228.1 hypothetical protein [Pseudomonas sp. BJa5]OQR38515.1 hypothetical protein BWR15_03085 [Pseudomonas sp. T]
MTRYGSANPISLLGQYALVSTICDADPTPELHCIQIVGVVPPLDQIISRPYFLVMDQTLRRPYPQEMFWHNIQSLKVLEPEEVEACKDLIPQDGIMMC